MRKAKPAPPQARKNQCGRRAMDGSGAARQCQNEGVPCWVKGDFSRMPMRLCPDCMVALRAIGWTVKLQIEGDNDPQQQGVGV